MEIGLRNNDRERAGRDEDLHGAHVPVVPGLKAVLNRNMLDLEEIDVGNRYLPDVLTHFEGRVAGLPAENGVENKGSRFPLEKDTEDCMAIIPQIVVTSSTDHSQCRHGVLLETGYRRK